MSSGIPHRVQGVLKHIFRWIIIGLVALVIIRIGARFLPGNKYIDKDGNITAKASSTEKKKDGKWFPTPGSASSTGLISGTSTIAKPPVFKATGESGTYQQSYSYPTSTYATSSSYNYKGEYYKK